MSRLLMNLRGVPEDEAGEVRALLEDHAVEYYETPPNRWGISAGAIWLVDEDEWARARQLLHEYQLERREWARAERRRDGPGGTFLERARREPVRVLLYVAIVAVLLYFTIRPFFGFDG